MITLCFVKVVHGHATISPLFSNFVPPYYCSSTLVNRTEMIEYNNTCNGQHADGPMYCYYDKGIHQPSDDYETIPTLFALTCDRAWINPFVTSLNRGGLVIGALLSAWFVKYFGLRDPLIIILCMNGLIFISLGYTTNIA